MLRKLRIKKRKAEKRNQSFCLYFNVFFVIAIISFLFMLFYSAKAFSYVDKEFKKIVIREETKKNKKEYNVIEKFDEIAKEIPLLLSQEISFYLRSSSIDLNKKDWNINKTFKNKFLKKLNKIDFEKLISKVANENELWDKKLIYVWRYGIEAFPEPYEYKEIIETEENFYIYSNTRIIGFDEMISVENKKYIDNIKYEYWYKDILCKEEMEYFEDNNNKTEEIFKNSNNFNNI
jgi:uncharacterized membrane protein